MTAPIIDISFPHAWQAEILASRPLILPQRHYVYPREAEEVERGALEVLVRPVESELGFVTGHNLGGEKTDSAARLVTGHDFSRAEATTEDTRALAPEGCPQPFLATCALGFRDPIVPTGLWSTPNPNEICAVSGGYAYIIDTSAPARFTMLPYRPVLDIRPALAEHLLLFVGHHSILAWGSEGQAWESGKLSDEGVTITSVENGALRGRGWELASDKETPFALDLTTGHRTS